jgi:hypothetical protein
MIIIGLSGRKRSGKDTVCEIIQRVFTGARRFAFADALKRELSEATDTPVHVIEQEKDRFRLGLQWWGTEFRRHQSDTYWVDQLMESLRMAEAHDCPVAIVTDCRFQNEADAIRSMGGKVLRIERATSPSQDCHASETSMDKYAFDGVIYNHGTINDLEDAVCVALDEILNGGTNMGAENGLATSRPVTQVA